MKIVIVVLLSFMFTFSSCGPSKADRQNVDAAIIIHNTTVYNDFVKDSLDADTKFQIENLNIKDDPKFRLLLIRNGIHFKNKWNNPYIIEKDFELTYDKYIEYCDKNGKRKSDFYKELK